MNYLATCVLLIFSTSIHAQSIEKIEEKLLKLYEAQARKVLLAERSDLKNEDLVLVSSTFQYKNSDSGPITNKFLTFVDKTTEEIKVEELPKINEESSIRERLKVLRAMSAATKSDKDFDGNYNEYVYKSYVVFLDIAEELKPIAESSHSQQRRVKP
ncbi:hypothetical protein [Microbulbifer aggregans]|uniref:hypothetical protein n=1 Tax=Microbulbifer aggregans TaxID=1769779 RepID=UPI0011AB2E9B|nr:hypothetical protein [Microbulbifer aggregans]